MRWATLTCMLVVLWLGLSGHFHEPLILALGVASVVIVLLLAARMGAIDPEGHPIHLSAGIITYWPWLLWEIVLSTVQVSRVILSPSMPLQLQVITLHATQGDDLGRVVFANSITLTPGTVTIAVEDSTLTVHALTDATAEPLRQSEPEMDRRVTQVVGGAD